MKTFKFESKVEPINICGKDYNLDTGNVDWIKQCLAKGDDIQVKLAAINEDELTPKKIDELIDVLKEAIDLFLGDGEFKRIYETPECNQNVRYLTAICNFLLEEIKVQAGK